MTKVENNCVGCEVCWSCGRNKQEVVVCDVCGDYAEYETSEGDFCECCLEEMWDNLPIEEKAELMGITIYSRIK